MINDLAVSCSLGNTKIRKIIFPFLQRTKFDTPAARLVLKYFSPRKDDNQIELAELSSFLASTPYVDKGDGEKKNLNFNEITKIVETVKTFINLPEDKIGESIKTFEIYYKQKLANNILSVNDSPEKIFDEFKNAELFDANNINVIDSKVVIERITDIDIYEELKRIGTPIPSFLPSINESCGFGGYIKGTVNLICAPPNVGKTLFMLNEAINFLRQGKKIYWLSVADMMKIDIITRMASISGDIPMKDVTSRFPLNEIEQSHYNTSVEEMLSKRIKEYFYWNNPDLEFYDNFYCSTVQSGKLSADDLESVVNNELNSILNKDVVDVIFLDYDGGIKKSGKNDNSYEEGEILFNKAEEIARDTNSKLIFIASQPAKWAYSHEVLYMDSIGESARKIQISDTGVFISKVTTSTGVVNIDKQRRGETLKFFYKKRKSGIIDEIDYHEYQEIKQEYDEQQKRFDSGSKRR
jgi:hypothetical protein